MSNYGEVYSFAVTCIKKGWDQKKACSCLGMNEEDGYIIKEAYHNYEIKKIQFSIFSSDDDE